MTAEPASQSSDTGQKEPSTVLTGSGGNSPLNTDRNREKDKWKRALLSVATEMFLEDRELKVERAVAQEFRHDHFDVDRYIESLEKGEGEEEFEIPEPPRNAVRIMAERKNQSDKKGEEAQDKDNTMQTRKNSPIST